MKYDLVFSSSMNSYFVFISIFHIHFFNLRTKILGTLFGTWFLHIKKNKTIFFFTNMLTIFFSQFPVWSFTKMSLDSSCWKWKCQKFFSYYVFILTFFEYWKWKWDNQKPKKKKKYKKQKKGKKEEEGNENRTHHFFQRNQIYALLKWPP